MYCSGGSGWVVETLKTLEIRTTGPFKGTASSFIETPAELKNLYRRLLNIKNKDEFCFLYSVLDSLFPPSTYSPYMDEVVYKLSDFPISLSKIPSFEKLNNVSISIYRFEQGRLLNFFFSKNRKCRQKVKFLQLVDHDKSHYCLIENFRNLMHHLTRSSSKRVGGPRARLCGNCMQSIVKHNFSNHVQFCEHHKALEIKMPDKTKKLTFENWQKTQLNPFVVYADLEAIDVASDGAGENNISNTIEIERQYPASFGAILIYSNCK